MTDLVFFQTMKRRPVAERWGRSGTPRLKVDFMWKLWKLKKSLEARGPERTQRSATGRLYIVILSQCLLENYRKPLKIQEYSVLPLFASHFQWSIRREKLVKSRILYAATFCITFSMIKSGAKKTYHKWGRSLRSRPQLYIPMDTTVCFPLLGSWNLL